MIQRKVVLEQPELHRSGLLQIKLAVLLIENDQEIDCKWHRTAIPLDGNAQLQMDAVNAHLTSEEMGLPAVSQADIDKIKEAHALIKSWHKGG